MCLTMATSVPSARLGLPRYFMVNRWRSTALLPSVPLHTMCHYKRK